MKDIVNIIMSFGLSDEEMFWLGVLILCVILWGVVETLYRTIPEYKITKTKDKNGNDVTVVSRIKK